MEIVRQHFSTIDSTNSYALKNAHLLEREKITLITADQQESGKGRGNRTWFSPNSNNLYATFCFFLPNDQRHFRNLSQILAISASKTLIDWGLQPTIKWPNDLLIRGKKIAGVLCELKAIEGYYCAINGIGINVNISEDELKQLPNPATSMQEELNRAIDLEKMILDLQTEFTKDLEQFKQLGFLPFFDRFNQLSQSFLNQPIRFHTGQMIQEGTVHSFNKDGSLNLVLHSGKFCRFYTGEIIN